MTKDGAEGNWNLESGKPHFNGQAASCLFALVIFAFSLMFTGTDKEDSKQQEINQLTSKIQTLEKSGLTFESYNQEIKRVETYLREIQTKAVVECMNGKSKQIYFFKESTQLSCLKSVNFPYSTSNSCCH